ncbi:MAG: bifunctional demethylmenaquinone methyltransferase/2-methoxy-6-polyprenyl-1,4-benzoquinol methylase UbiE [Bacteroidia bacterium]|nr:bifunctional demethylmenaquinone methyltransferase/2-methoxy-6-polyprenyl-1,4-benzoquinol methylase UbiE [Bacteroidia bacterium]
MSSPVTPYQGSASSKKAQVEKMFDNIAGTYDLLNHLLSAGIDTRWRKYAIRQLLDLKPETILDIATGTGDFAILAAKTLKPKQLIGLDLSEKMLAKAREKAGKKGLSIDWIKGDSEKLPFADNTIDAITIGFGVRNFENLQLGLSEVLRVLRPGGKAVILEPSKPKKFPMKQLFSFYFHTVLPLVGKIISKDSSAYTYLPESVKVFPEGDTFLDICHQAGFRKTFWQPLTFGICAFYCLEK